MKTYIRFTGCGGVVIALLIAIEPLAQTAEVRTTFASPEDAVQALATAAGVKEREAVRALFGLDADELVAADPVQIANDMDKFLEAFQVKHHLTSQSDGKVILEVGKDDWPFPIPLAKQDGGRWYFDTDAGKDELLSRRIGRNELATLETIRVYVEAQREYASRDRNGSQVLQYAQKFASTPGKKDGLYWAPDLDGEISPLGPLVAEARSEGYKKKGDEPIPYHGYFFKILTRQGKHVPGGAYDYIINGNMIAGFALVAWPAQYGESGIMTFTVNQQGRVYQKNLGPKTDLLAAALKEYDPDTSWQVSPD